jgi:hypothetical protein
MRFKGLEQLYTYLDAAIESYSSIPKLADLAFLVRRVRADFETALEATLSGYQGVASDAMRDVMEIEGLLLDFAAHAGNAEEWLRADRKMLVGKYSPGAVRARLKAAGIEPYANAGFEPIDYRGHSQALHVTPYRMGLSERGPEPDGMFPWFTDLGFIEMFEHGNRILLAIEMLRVIGLGVPDDYTPLTPRDAFDAAYERTREMQVVLIALIEGPKLLLKRLNRKPTASEIWTYVRDELGRLGPRAGQENAEDWFPRVLPT